MSTLITSVPHEIIKVPHSLSACCMNIDEIRACISVGRELQMRGHRVRVVTHSIFQNLVKKLGLEFFSASTDPEHSIAVSLYRRRKDAHEPC